MSKGFYIALCFLVAALGFTIYSGRLRADLRERQASFEEVLDGAKIDPEKVSVIDIDGQEKPLEEKPVNSFEKVPEVVETSAVSAAKTEKPKFAMEMPHSGEIIEPCSLDELLYSETMKDWRTHNGIDIAAKVGEQVRAAESGTVTKVLKDELFGVVVTIDHGNGILTNYANLQSEDFIKVGTKVKKGDIIGGVGKSGALEEMAEPHLHFEVVSNGEYKDPREFLSN